jgi:hypothetical protein
MYLGSCGPVVVLTASGKGNSLTNTREHLAQNREIVLQNLVESMRDQFVVQIGGHIANFTYQPVPISNVTLTSLSSARYSFARFSTLAGAGFFWTTLFWMGFAGDWPFWRLCLAWQKRHLPYRD